MANREFRKRQREFGKKKPRTAEQQLKDMEKMRRYRKKRKQIAGPKPQPTEAEARRNAEKMRRSRKKAKAKRQKRSRKSFINLKFNFVTYLALLLKTILNQLPNTSLFPLFYQSVKRLESHYFESQRKLKFYKSFLSNHTKVKGLFLRYVKQDNKFRHLHSGQTLN